MMRSLGLVMTMVLVLLAVPADAMRVAPMVAELTTTGVGSAARIEVGNIGSAALPFETRITRIEMGPNGEIIETPADEDFLIFPPQGLVPVSGRQVVRVQWVGAPDLASSQAYFLTVRQLPVSTDIQPRAEGEAPRAAVQILYTMKPLIVVAPPGAEPDVKVESARVTMIQPPTPDIDPELAGTPEQQAAATPPPVPGVEVVVANAGRRYALMSGATWVIEGTGADGQPLVQTLSHSTVSSLVGVGYLAPAGGRRTFQIATEQPFASDKPVTVRFTK